MHGQHPEAAIGPHGIFSDIVGLLLGDHACTGATPLSWPKEMVLVVAVGHCYGGAQAFSFKKMH